MSPAPTDLTPTDLTPRKPTPRDPIPTTSGSSTTPHAQGSRPSRASRDACARSSTADDGLPDDRGPWRDLAPHEVACCDTGTPFRTGSPGGLQPREAARLCRARLLRHLLLDVYVPADVPDGPLVRSAAVACLVPERLVAAGGVVALSAAAWVLVGGTPPPVVDVLLPPGRNLAGNRTWLCVHQRRCDHADILRRGPLRLTGPRRTAADLARRQEPPAELAVLRALGEVGSFTPADLERFLGAVTGGRGVRLARHVLADWPTAGTGVSLASAQRSDPDDGVRPTHRTSVIT